MRMFLLISYFLISFSSQAQQDSSISESKRKFLFGFDSRRSIIENKPSRIFGIRIGMQLKNPRVRIGLGAYNMQNQMLRPNESVAEVAGSIDTLRIDYGYLGFFYEYVWLEKNKYEVSTPFLLGAGSVDRSYFTDTGDLQKLPKLNITVLEVGVAAHYKFLPWLGVGSGFGYNLVLSGRPELSRAFNSPFYVLKVKLFLGELYRSLRKKNL
jgi:hypothetical protein